MRSSALLFPGQGAQLVGMGKALCHRFAECQEVFDRANDILGYDLAGLCFAGPEANLTKSVHAQPAIFVTSVAAYTALKRSLPELAFAAGAGLSSGEWTALYAAEALGFAEALRVLQARGQYMQDACEETPGAMLSVIGLESDALQGICRECEVEMANLNAPGQTVLSGTVKGIEAAERRTKEAGARKIMRLNVAGAFHSRLMASAARRLEAFLADVFVSKPAYPVLSNVTGAPHNGPESIRRRMVEQVTAPVRWVDGVRWMREHGVQEYVECGPQKVLSGLVKRIDKEAALHNIQDPTGLERVVEALSSQES